MFYFNYLHINNPKARQVVIEQMNTHNLIDIYIYRERENSTQMLKDIHGGNLTP